MNRRKFTAAAAATLAGAVIPSVGFSEVLPSYNDRLNWLNYAENISVKVKESDLEGVLKILRPRNVGYGVEWLEDGWCGVHIGPKLQLDINTVMLVSSAR